MTHKRYELIDLYETGCDDGGELICTSDDIEEIRQAAKDWNDQTDGECELFVREWKEAGAC